MIKVATADVLSKLHAALAHTMGEALSAEQARIAVTKELLDMDISEADESLQKTISGILSLAPTARVDNGLLKTIAAFLKDNDITTHLSDDEDADEIAERLAEMQGKRRKVPLPTDHLAS